MLGEAKKSRFQASRKKREGLSRRFFAAVQNGNTEGLVGRLAANVVAYADGGGRARAFPRPVDGRNLHELVQLMGAGTFFPTPIPTLWALW
jgi:RNA polymerase sigma-70 factor (ECF subfamily)